SGNYRQSRSSCRTPCCCSSRCRSRPPTRSSSAWLHRLPWRSPLNSDVNAAARTEHAAITAAGDDGRNTVFFADDEAMGVGIGLAAIVLALRGLITQAELQPAIAGRKPG